MSSYDNIKPYSEMCHECAMAGGPEAYMNHLAHESECKGRFEGAILTFLTIETIKFVLNHREELKRFKDTACRNFSSKYQSIKNKIASYVETKS